MTQPTQEDKVCVCTEILGLSIHTDSKGEKWLLHPIIDEWVALINFDPYTDDSFTGALVKAVFPLLAERDWLIQINYDGSIDIIKIGSYSHGMRDYTHKVLILTAPNLNTALIEVWKKIEGEKK